ncbi:ATP-binding cassette domain-containing protein [Bifidobacterium sp. ESL0728]|uniref:ATP-binding cassette domain-containing protein n=1 Tax=Bifidobacterium sp. ESL0728 TaxID=2983220 RepID=UPI0023FA4291|nr:ATP-binding cassette domain-containing protein [Bifidobacterium sp. ESL0728]WEV59254.1 ATP-binding cassette domain-containing protein [Bifidobacterium sp. ESL0728]
MITIEHVSKVIGQATVLNNVDFTALDGRVTGFLGPNGAGKSTTIRVAMGLAKPNSGQVIFDGVPFNKASVPMNLAGAVLDAKSAHKNRTAYSHLHTLAMSNGIPDRRVDEVLELAGLQAVKNSKVSTFSLGMNQRLSIAAALLGDPHNLVLDEPVNGLDPEGVKWVRDLCRMFAEQGRAVLLSSHLMSEVALAADDLVVISQGHILERSTVDDFVARHSSHAIRVAVDDVNKLSAVVASIPGLRMEAAGRIPTDSRQGSVWRLFGADEATLAHAFTSAQLTVYELSDEAVSLEDAYLALTHGQGQYAPQPVAQPFAVQTPVNRFPVNQPAVNRPPANLPTATSQPVTTPQPLGGFVPAGQQAPQPSNRFAITNQPTVPQMSLPIRPSNPVQAAVPGSPQSMHVSFGRSVACELVKLASFKSTWWIVGLIVVCMPLFALIPEGYDSQLTTSTYTVWFHLAGNMWMVSLFAAVFGVIAVAGEYSSTLIDSSLMANPRRPMFMGAKAVSACIYVSLATIVGYAFAFPTAWLHSLSTLAGYGSVEVLPGSMVMALLAFVGGPIMMSCVTLIGMGVAAICRSMIGSTVATLILLTFPSMLIQAFSTGAKAYMTYVPTFAVMNFLRGPRMFMSDSKGWLIPQICRILSVFSDDKTRPEMVLGSFWGNGFAVMFWAALIFGLGVFAVSKRDVK